MARAVPGADRPDLRGFGGGVPYAARRAGRCAEHPVRRDRRHRFRWIEPFGGLIRTPAIERLANNGLRYTNFTTTALCSPTRSCLITGRNHHSVGMANIPELASGFPGYNARQPQNKAGVAAMLHEHGYTSFCLGKWHNTPSEETGISGPYDRWPVGPVFGFDRFYGFLGGDSDQWYPKLFMDREAIDQPRLP